MPWVTQGVMFGIVGKEILGSLLKLKLLTRCRSLPIKENLHPKAVISKFFSEAIVA